MVLNNENYFSKEADMEYMSVSQFKNFKTCEAKAYNDLQCDSQDSKSAFLEGHLFEELVAGDAQLFLAQHPEMVSSRGATAGQLKAEYQKVISSANRFNEQEMFKYIVNKCEKQVIITGEIEGVPVKCCLDLLDRKNNKIYDIKCMKDFKEQWSSQDKKYIPWYYNWGYVLQLAVYREIAKQNFRTDFTTHLISATKETEPDLQALEFSNDLLDIELEEFKTYIKHYDNIKKGLEAPIRCENCDYCKRTKVIKKWEVIK